ARLALPGGLRPGDRPGPVRQLRGCLGRSQAPRPVHAALRSREGPSGSPQARPQRRRTGPARWLDQADHPDGSGPLKTIEITVSPTGESKVQTRGFAGTGCKEASRFIEQALGRLTAETLTAEFYQGQQNAQELEQSQ